MADRVTAPVLWTRASCVGLVAFALGVVGHVSAEGLLPGPAMLTALLVFSVAISAPLLNRPASSPRIVSMLVGGQAGIHFMLTVTAGHRGDAPADAPALPTALRLPVVDGRRVGSLQDAYHGMSGQSSSLTPSLPVSHLVSDLSAHAPMMAAHLLAAAAVGLWLAHGEHCLWTLLALTGRRILGATWTDTPVLVPAPPLTRADFRTPGTRASRWRTRPHWRRGPPLLAI